MLRRIPDEERIVAVNGMEMHYESYGEGDPLVLLHGFFGCTNVWKPYIPVLSPHFRLIAVDLRGHGLSTNPSKVFTHRQAAYDTYALLDTLGIERFKAIGVSSGGMTLIHMATQQPHRVEAMVTVIATTYFPSQCRAQQAKSSAENLSAEQWNWYRKIHQHGDEQIRDLIRQFRVMADTYDDMNFTPPYLSTITARTLIVHGDRDPLFPVSIAVEMYNAIPHSYLWVVPNRGHAFPQEAAQMFVDTAVPFLRGEWNQS